MNFSLSRCAILWLGCMAGYSSSLRDYPSEQGLRRLTVNLDENAESTASSDGSRGGASWPGPQAGYVGPTSTNQRIGDEDGGGNKDQAMLGVPSGEIEEVDSTNDIAGTHHERKTSQTSNEFTVRRSTSSSKGSKSSKQGSKSSKKSSKASGQSKSGKSSKSKGSKSNRGDHDTNARAKDKNEGTTRSPKPRDDTTKATKTGKPTVDNSQTDNSSDAVDEEQNTSTVKPTRGTDPVDDADRVSDFPSQAPTCQECDDIETLTALNKLASEQDHPMTRRHVAKIVAAIGVGVAAMLWIVLVIMRFSRRRAVHSRIEAIHDDNPAKDSKFSDSDVTVVVFEDDDDDDDLDEDAALEA